MLRPAWIWHLKIVALAGRSKFAQEDRSVKAEIIRCGVDDIGLSTACLIGIGSIFPTGLKLCTGDEFKIPAVSKHGSTLDPLLVELVLSGVNPAAMRTDNTRGEIDKEEDDFVYVIILVVCLGAIDAFPRAANDAQGFSYVIILVVCLGAIDAFAATM